VWNWSSVDLAIIILVAALGRKPPIAELLRNCEISFIYMPYSIRLGMPIIKADSPTSVGKNTSIAG